LCEQEQDKKQLINSELKILLQGAKIDADKRPPKLKYLPYRGILLFENFKVNGYCSIPTFAPLMKASILEIRSELGAGTRGASLGPQAVMIASLVLGSGYFKRYKVKTLQQKFEHLVGDIQFPTAKRIRAIGQMNSSVILAVSSIIKEKKRPFSGCRHHCSA
jgi:hypothetical protein